METASARTRRKYGYDVLINSFEPTLRKYVSDQVFLVNYGNDWIKHIPQGVINELMESKQIQSIGGYPIDEFTFLNLKDILAASGNFKLARSFFGELSKDRFNELMDDLNKHRRKIAHSKSTFSELDLSMLIDHVKMLCQGEQGKEIIRYLQNEGYKDAGDIPQGFFEEYPVPHNLPFENYDLDGGFVGREKEIKVIRNFLKSGQDRVITITGAGGVGKTAIALKVAYSFLADQSNDFNAIIWFSAKTSMLTEKGIVPMTPGIMSREQLILDILGILDPDTLSNFRKANVPTESYITHLNNFFSTHKCLLVVDNLETIIRDEPLIRFIEEIPRPSQVLITSRKGLGEFERRYPIADMTERDAVLLFRIFAKERNRQDLLRLKDETLSELVRRVRCYPLLIKWAIGQVCLGKDVDRAFSQIFAGESEIAKFAFDDVFNLLTDYAKTVLYSMIVYGDKPTSRYILIHLANVNDDQFEDAIRELTLTSFVYPENKDTEAGTVTEYTMLELTRGFVETKLDSNEKTRQMLTTRLYHLAEQIQEFEKSERSYFQSLISLGIKTPEEQVAFNYVKAAKNFYFQGETDKAEKNFQQAVKIAPKLSYVLTEFSKFEFSREHHAEAIKLAKRAVEANPENFHAWFNQGIMLEKTRDLDGAEKSLLKAKELNPQHLPIFTELGRVYSLKGEFEKAETEYANALKEEKYPNYRHKTITFQAMSENYRRWATSFRNRRDPEGAIKMLEKAKEMAVKAIDMSPKDRIIWNVYHHACIDLAIAHAHKEGFARCRPHLEECLKSTRVGRVLISPDSETTANAYFYLAALGLDEKDEKSASREEIERWINLGLSACLPNSRIFDKLNNLKNQLLGTEKHEEKTINREYGKIRFFNVQRKFGLLDSAGKTYLFFINGFRQRMRTESLYVLEGKLVSFVLVQSPKEGSGLIAVDLVTELQPGI
ncbi:tetratricopeptide repeat protein [Candidatus Bathyarchaeota archaeon]|nr:tetratricopeptide repeat protein [Candidatus Bathyarchaeota archaeon]